MAAPYELRVSPAESAVQSTPFNVATRGYLETGLRIGVWPDSVQVLGETL